MNGNLISRGQFFINAADYDETPVRGLDEAILDFEKKGSEDNRESTSQVLLHLFCAIMCTSKRCHVIYYY